jgi:hypothetical protein
MTVSIPLLTLMAIFAYVAYRHMGLRAWHAVVCLILGFLLASTGPRPRSTAFCPASSTRRKPGSPTERADER